ncbi:hypothetical protein N9018_03885, partial [Rhodopirellula sp.]|nr:hypothetical protein [Rhodopirellula sp.]
NAKAITKPSQLSASLPSLTPSLRYCTGHTGQHKLQEPGCKSVDAIASITIQIRNQQCRPENTRDVSQHQSIALAHQSVNVSDQISII